MSSLRLTTRQEPKRLGFQRPGPRNKNLRFMMDALIMHGRVRTTKAKALILQKRANRLVSLVRNPSYSADQELRKYIYSESTILPILYTTYFPHWASKPSNWVQTTSLGRREFWEQPAGHGHHTHIRDLAEMSVVEFTGGVLRHFKAKDIVGDENVKMEDYLRGKVDLGWKMLVRETGRKGWIESLRRDALTRPIDQEVDLLAEEAGLLRVEGDERGSSSTTTSSSSTSEISSSVETSSTTPPPAPKSAESEPVDLLSSVLKDTGGTTSLSESTLSTSPADIRAELVDLTQPVDQAIDVVNLKTWLFSGEEELTEKEFRLSQRIEEAVAQQAEINGVDNMTVFLDAAREHMLKLQAAHHLEPNLAVHDPNFAYHNPSASIIESERWSEHYNDDQQDEKPEVRKYGRVVEPGEVTPAMSIRLSAVPGLNRTREEWEAQPRSVHYNPLAVSRGVLGRNFAPPTRASVDLAAAGPLGRLFEVQRERGIDHADRLRDSEMESKIKAVREQAKSLGVEGRGGARWRWKGRK